MTSATRYSYEAVTASGKFERGALSAESEFDARRVLADRGLLPFAVKPITLAQQRAAISTADLATGLRILADLIDAGLSISRVLRTFEELAPAGWRAALPSMQVSVKQGAGLATALANAPIAVPPVVLGIAHAGEAGQGMGSAIRQAAELMEGAAATRAAIRSALAYPIVLAIAGMLAIGVLIGVVLPQFATILADLNQSLPPATRVVLGMSNAFKVGIIPFSLIAGATTLVWRLWLQTPGGRIRWNGVLLGTPVFGKLRLSMATARAAHTLAALLSVGVPVAVAMKFAASASGNALVEARTLTARGLVLQGSPLSRALSDEQAFTPAATRLLRSGEESGRLVSMLQHAAHLEQQQSDRAIQTLVKLLEPVLVFLFAALVALVAAALLQAVYSVRPTA